MMWKAIQGDAIETARIHPAVHPGNRDDSCSHGKRDLGWTEPRSREPSQSALSYKHIKNFTKDLEVRRDIGNRARGPFLESPGNFTGLKSNIQIEI